jgi:hypothetical protein
MRRNVEIDLPSRFLELHGPQVDRFIESARPGDTWSFAIVGPLVPAALVSPFVSTSAIERNVITIRAVELASSSGPCLLIEPADKHSRRLVDEETERLTPAQSHLEEPGPLKSAFQQDDYSPSGHRGGSRPIPTGLPITGTFGGIAGW